MPKVKTQAELAAEAENPTPTSAPAEETVAEVTPAEPAPEETGGSEPDGVWDELLDETDDDTVIPQAEEVTGATEEEPPAEETPPEPVVEPAPAEEEPAPEPTAEQVTPEPEVTPPEVPEETPPAETRTQEEQQAQWEETRAKAEGELVERFKLTEEQEQQFIESPNEVLPQLTAKLYLDILDSMMGGIRQQLPSMIQGVMQMQEIKQQADTNFYTAWPALAKPEHRETVMRIRQSYQQLNPNATEEQAIKEAGAQAWVALRLPLDELAQLTQPTPAAPPAEEGTVTPIRQPASPGNAPSGARHPTPVQPQNEFTAFAEEIIDEED